MKLKEIKKRRAATTDIKSMLWVSFTALLLLVVAIIGVSEYFLFTNSYKETVEQEQLKVCKSLYDELSDKPDTKTFLSSSQINEIIIDAMASGDGEIYILSEEGVVYFPYRGDGPFDSMTDAATVIQQKLAQYTDGSVGQSVGYTYNGMSCRATKIVISELSLYLYLVADPSISSTFTSMFLVQIVFITLIVLLGSSVIIAIISSRISEPISSINVKAKQLGAGNFDVDFYTSLDSCREIHELSASLNYTKEELSKADQMQKELIANVTHDFKTPLTMIKAYASMIQEISGDNPEKRNKHCQVIIDESDRLASLVNDLLEISKLRAGINTLKPTIFNLSEFTGIIVDRFSYLRETQGYTIETDIAPDLYTEADKDKIGQVIYNLIGNAVNYTGDDKTIKIRLLSNGNTIRFDVKDTGAGISADEIEHIWDRYYRSKDNHKRPIQGTGLGLSIVKTVLTKHDFKFGVTSEKGKGSTFYVDFPLRTVWSIESAESDE